MTPVDWAYVDDRSDELSDYYKGGGKIIRA